MNTIHFVLIFYYIFSFIVEESRLLYKIINDCYLNNKEKWVYAIITTIIIIVVAPISFPIITGKVLGDLKQ